MLCDSGRARRGSGKLPPDGAGAGVIMSPGCERSMLTAIPMRAMRPRVSSSSSRQHQRRGWRRAQRAPQQVQQVQQVAAGALGVPCIPFPFPFPASVRRANFSAAAPEGETGWLLLLLLLEPPNASDVPPRPSRFQGDPPPPPPVPAPPPPPPLPLPMWPDAQLPPSTSCFRESGMMTLLLISMLLAWTVCVP